MENNISNYKLATLYQAFVRNYQVLNDNSKLKFVEIYYSLPECFHEDYRKLG